MWCNKMMLNVKQSRFKLTINSRKKLLFVSLLFVLMISCFSSCMLMVQGAESVPVENVVHVSSEGDLRYVVKVAEGGAPVVIVLDGNIGLSGTTLDICNAEITLRSDKELASDRGVEFFSLFGTTSGVSTITVGTGGVLRLDGIIVTHYDASGSGVTVNGNGQLIMSDGEISDNTMGLTGGGVYVQGGSFVMSGCEISGNAASGSGGGVYVSGSFEMMGGVISGNTAGSGGGVYVQGGSFVMSGGEISGNAASGSGGGVYVSGSFEMMGGVISGNTGGSGGGVYVYSSGSFVMSGGEISGNTNSGVCSGGSFVMSGGEISGNVASGNGGGVYVIAGSFVMYSGVISDNTASGAVGGGNGGGVYVQGGSFVMSGGEISGNVASGSGGGVWVTATSTNLDRFSIPLDAVGVVFSNNRASSGYDRASVHDSVYVANIQGEVVSWSAPFTQGYNNYDISYTTVGGAHPSFLVTVIGSNAPVSGVGNYVVGANVRIDVGPAPEGEEFKTWTTSSPGVDFADAKNAVTTFFMPDHDVTVEAVFGDIDSCVHTYVDEITVAATCVSEGVKTFTCSKCDDSYTEPIAKDSANHVGGTYKAVITPPTFEVEGSMGIYCSGCNEQLDTESIPCVYYIQVSSVTGKAGDEVTLIVSLVNNPGIASYSLTMRFPSELEYKVAGNGDILSSNFYVITSTAGQVSVSANSPMGADISTGSVLFTITFRIDADVADGVIINEESGLVLGFFRTVGGSLVDGIEHDRDRLAFPPGKIVQGEIRVESDVCVHDYVAGVPVAPTCEAKGYTTYTCSRCGDHYDADFVDALGHAFGEWVVDVPATCTEAGQEKRVCANDESHVEYRSIPANGDNHVGGTYEKVITPATVMSEGVMGIYCKGCDELLGTKPIDKLPDVQKDYVFLKERVAGILKNGLSQDNLRLNGKVLTLVIDGREFVLSTNANNRNIEGEISLGDGYFLRFDIKGNGSNIKMFDIILK